MVFVRCKGSAILGNMQVWRDINSALILRFSMQGTKEPLKLLLRVSDWFSVND